MEIKKKLRSVDLSPQFDSAAFEDEVYKAWRKHRYFEASGSAEAPPFVIVIPPPNVTGILHLGHGLNNCLQDILIRYHRMRGAKTLWVPGTDHAGIATQSVVEREMQQEGLKREDLGREAFLERTQTFATQHKRTILRQLQKIGASCDWSRERFTLDEGLSHAVRHVFVQLYERGLIYKGNYIVNWSVANQTALSDDEVSYKEVRGTLYYIRYPFADASGYIDIATTRPETMFADVAVAVHPEDERYRTYHGKTLLLPLTDKEIPLIADEAVERDFGTGALKITPGHAVADYEIGHRHRLPAVNILNLDGTLNDEVPPRYRGLSVDEARKRSVEDLDSEGFLQKTEDILHQVGHGDRGGDVIEPLISEQWFVKMRPLADKALKAFHEGAIRFYPKKWEATYLHWLENVRDWCISRQLWWGHRIPVWYDQETGEPVVTESDPHKLPQYKGRHFEQDPDVLDTWFSSWLWPFSVFGWPQHSADLAAFYPTQALVTGYDIIFFWVSRMIMAALEFTGTVPFRDIYITNLLRDTKGRKMSKSLGNGVDPLHIVEQYGADALRFTLAFLCSQGNDIYLEDESFTFGSKFVNKVWNASRYILSNLEGCSFVPLEDIALDAADRWILHRINLSAEAVQRAMEQYRFNDASRTVYDFFWNDLCDWYLETSKLALYGNDAEKKNNTVSLLLILLEESLRLMHPFLPFVTEELFGKLPAATTAPQVIVASYPQPSSARQFPEEHEAFGALQELVRSVRSTRSELTIPRAKKISVILSFEAKWPHAAFVKEHTTLIASLVQAEDIAFKDTMDHARVDNAISVAGSGFQADLLVRDFIDVETHRARIEKTLGKLQAQLAATEKKLSNTQFLERAQPRVVAKEQDKERSLRELIGKNSKLLRMLSG